MSLIQDYKIVAQILKGNTDKYSFLVEKYKKPIFNLAYRMTGKYEDADDLSQETFLKAFESLEYFQPGSDFFPWIYAISLNLIRNHLKKKNFFLNNIEISLLKIRDFNTESPEVTFSKLQSNEKLFLKLQKLPLNLKEAIVLRTVKI